jgi:hypothetical protein
MQEASQGASFLPPSSYYLSPFENASEAVYARNRAMLECFFMPDRVIKCEQCGIPFVRTHKMRPNRKFCGRDCYKLSCREFDRVPYPVIWHNGKREYLHRVIWMQNHPEETLGPDDIVHHIDENPFNREPANLEKISGRAAHLHKHDYHRGVIAIAAKKAQTSEYDPKFGF